MTTTITLPHQVSFYQWTISNEVGLNTGTLGSASVGNEYSLFMIGSNDSLINTAAILNAGAEGAIGIRGTNDLIVNQPGGKIENFVSGGVGIYGGGAPGNAPATVTSFGVIASGQGAGGVAIDLVHGGFVSNAATGTLIGSGVFNALSAATVLNAGLILGDSVYGGVDLGAGGLVTNQAGGTISANGAGYGVEIVGGTGTVTNAGTIIGTAGSYAVEFGGSFSSRVIVDPGAVFVGAVTGGTAADATLELASGASTGTLSGIGTQFTNFGTLTFDPSAAWLVAASTALSATVINSFTAGDTIDLTGFVATSSAFASNGHVTL